MAAICHTVYDKYVYVRGPQNLWEAGAPHPWDEGMADPHRNTSLPATCYRVKFGRRSYEKYVASAGKILPLTSRLSRSLKVIGTDKDRSATYDFLLVLHSNWHVVYIHSPIQTAISVENYKFSNLLMYLTPPLRELDLEFTAMG